MATNLVSLVMQFVTPDMIAKIASALGLDREAAQKAIGGAVPAILSGLAGVASAPGGVRQLSNALAQQGGGMLDSIGGLIGGPGQKALADSGGGMLSSLLGGGTMGALAQSVGQFAGIGQGASRSLLGMLAPVVTGALDHHQRDEGLTANGLAQMLTSQKDQIASAIPSGLADQLSASGVFDKLTGNVRSGAAAASAAMGRAGDAAYESANAAYAARSSAPSQWPLWLIGGVIIGGLLWYFLSGSGHETVADATPPAAVTPAPQAPPNQTTAAKTDRLETRNVSLYTGNMTVGGVNLVNYVNTSVGGLKSALEGITDTASAQAAMPKIRDAMTRLDQVGTLSQKLSPDGRSALAKLIAGTMPTVNQLCDKVLATPGAGGIAKPMIDELRVKLDNLSRA
jgi:hypothetical protein